MKMVLSIGKPIHYYQMEPVEEAAQPEGVVVEVTEAWYEEAVRAMNAYDAVMDACADLLKAARKTRRTR